MDIAAYEDAEELWRKIAGNRIELTACTDDERRFSELYPVSKDFQDAAGFIETARKELGK